MSLADFQRALCTMTLNPVLAATVRRDGAAGLRAYELTPAEAGRLTAAVRQHGMSVNCTLARANRFAPIADAFPLTCSLLKPELRALLDSFWNEHTPDGYQLTGEVAAFAEFLRGALNAGSISHPFARDVFEYDLAVWSLIQTLRGATSTSIDDIGSRTLDVHFTHDPHLIVPVLERGELPRLDLPEGQYVVSLSLRGDAIEAYTSESS